MKYIVTAIILAFLAYGGWYACTREKDLPLVQPTPHEAARHQQIAAEKDKRGLYAADTLKTYKRFKTLQRTNDSLTTELSRKQVKAQNSAQKFAVSGKVEDCHHALTDCQQENTTQRYALAVQDTMLNEAEQAQKKDRKEIARNYTALDSAFSGWGKANADLSRTEAELQKVKGKRFVLSAGVGYGLTPNGLQPNVSVQVGYVIKRF